MDTHFRKKRKITLNRLSINYIDLDFQVEPPSWWPLGKRASCWTRAIREFPLCKPSKSTKKSNKNGDKSLASLRTVNTDWNQKGEKDRTQQRLAANRLKQTNKEVPCQLIQNGLYKNSGFRLVNKEKFETIKEEIVQVNTRMNKSGWVYWKGRKEDPKHGGSHHSYFKLHTKLEKKLLNPESCSWCENVRM